MPLSDVGALSMSADTVESANGTAEESAAVPFAEASIVAVKSLLLTAGVGKVRPVGPVADSVVDPDGEPPTVVVKVEVVVVEEAADDGVLNEGVRLDDGVTTVPGICAIGVLVVPRTGVGADV